MGRHAKTTPTDAELELLKALWEIGDCTVRDLHDRVVKDRDVSYASVSKLISLMIGKGLVTVVDGRRPQRIRAAADKESTLSKVVGEMRRVVFGGSMKEMLSYLLGSSDKAGVAEAQRMIDEAAKASKQK